MKDFPFGVHAVWVDLGLKSGVSLRLEGSRHESNLVSLEQRFEEISTTDVKEMLNFIVARVLPETLVVQVGFVDLDRAALIAHHKLLEV